MDPLYHIILIVAVLIGQTLCGSFSLQPLQQTAKQAVTFNPRFNFFDIDLLRQAADDTTGNIMISPASIKSTLAMLLEGAYGECADELRRALRLPVNQDEFRAELSIYLSSLKSKSENVTLENANGVFLSDRLRPNIEYDQYIRKLYFAELASADFRKPDVAALQLNQWVSNRTHGLIPELLAPENIEQNSLVIVLNALYFRAVWETAFDPEETTVRCFSTVHGCRQVYMMESLGLYNYGEIENARLKAIELPYQGGKYSMIVLLPNEKDGVAGVIRDLPYMSLPHLLAQMEPSDVQLSLPRFSVEFAQDMVPVLQNIGIKKLFTRRANLSGIVEGNDNPYVENVFHKTFIEVNELGSVAAAVSGAMVVPLMGSGAAHFHADRPFLFFIRDVETGAVLFEGKIHEPIEAVLPSATTTATGQAAVENPKTPLKEVSAKPEQQTTAPTNPTGMTDRFLDVSPSSLSHVKHVRPDKHAMNKKKGYSSIYSSGYTQTTQSSLSSNLARWFPRQPNTYSQTPNDRTFLLINSPYHAALLLSKMNSGAIIMDLAEFYNDASLENNQLTVNNDHSVGLQREVPSDQVTSGGAAQAPKSRAPQVPAGRAPQSPSERAPRVPSRRVPQVPSEHTPRPLRAAFVAPAAFQQPLPKDFDGIRFQDS